MSKRQKEFKCGCRCRMGLWVLCDIHRLELIEKLEEK